MCLQRGWSDGPNRLNEKVSYVLSSLEGAGLVSDVTLDVLNSGHDCRSVMEYVLDDSLSEFVLVQHNRCPLLDLLDLRLS